MMRSDHNTIKQAFIAGYKAARKVKLDKNAQQLEDYVIPEGSDPGEYYDFLIEEIGFTPSEAMFEVENRFSPEEIRDTFEAGYKANAFFGKTAFGIYQPFFEVAAGFTHNKFTDLAEEGVDTSSWGHEEIELIVGNCVKEAADYWYDQAKANDYSRDIIEMCSHKRDSQGDVYSILINEICPMIQAEIMDDPRHWPLAY